MLDILKQYCNNDSRLVLPFGYAEVKAQKDLLELRLSVTVIFQSRYEEEFCSLSVIFDTHSGDVYLLSEQAESDVLFADRDGLLCAGCFVGGEFIFFVDVNIDTLQKYKNEDSFLVAFLEYCQFNVEHGFNVEQSIIDYANKLLEGAL